MKGGFFMETDKTINLELTADELNSLRWAMYFYFDKASESLKRAETMADLFPECEDYSLEVSLKKEQYSYFFDLHRKLLAAYQKACE